MLDRFSAKLFSSSADDFEAIRGLRAHGLSVADAVHRLAYPDGEPSDDDDGDGVMPGATALSATAGLAGANG